MQNSKKVRGIKTKLIPDELVIDLHAPGMTPLLRAGLGGLAASLRAIGGDQADPMSQVARADPAQRVARTGPVLGQVPGQVPGYAWPAPVPLGPGAAVVEPTRITLRWGSDPAATLGALFAGAFQIRNGLIHLPGAWDPTRAWTIQLGAALQLGLKRTFLQHGTSTKKEGALRPHAFTIDDRTIAVKYQPYARFKHQEETVQRDILKGLTSGSVELAGWANPGAVSRHNAFSVTEWTYGPAEALCGIFAIVGCLSLEVTQSGGAGALVILEPDDLVRFAEIRPRLSPDTLEDAYVAGTSDAVLHVHLVLRMERLARKRSARKRVGIAAVQGVTLRATPWATQIKSRIATVSPTAIPEATLDAYDIAARTLPVKLRIEGGKDKARGQGDDSGGYFAVASALRGWIADNLAQGRRWFAGFTTATTLDKRPRFLHRYRTIKDNLGALRPEERSGLIAMIDQLEAAEKHFVRSIHTALRQRFGAIAQECEGNIATMKNRWQGERDRWRIAFAGAKTHAQIRAALADLWSRAGTNSELRAHWEGLLPLLREQHWQAARDLGLVALASYQSTADTNDDDDSNGSSDAAEA